MHAEHAVNAPVHMVVRMVRAMEGLLERMQVDLDARGTPPPLGRQQFGWRRVIGIRVHPPPVRVPCPANRRVILVVPIESFGAAALAGIDRLRKIHVLALIIGDGRLAPGAGRRGWLLVGHRAVLGGCDRARVGVACDPSVRSRPCPATSMDPDRR